MSHLVRAPSAVTDEKLVENQAEEGGSGQHALLLLLTPAEVHQHPGGMAHLSTPRARVTYFWTTARRCLLFSMKLTRRLRRGTGTPGRRVDAHVARAAPPPLLATEPAGNTNPPTPRACAGKADRGFVIADAFATPRRSLTKLALEPGGIPTGRRRETTRRVAQWHPDSGSDHRVSPWMFHPGYRSHKYSVTLNTQTTSHRGGL